MLDEQLVSQLKSTLENAQSLLIVISEQSSLDEVAASIGIHLTLRNAGKDSRLVSVRSLPAAVALLPGADQVAQELGNENLTISFDYSEDTVDKVSYHIGEDTKKFYLTIKPKSGHPPLDTSTLEFNYTGASADLIILSGVTELDELMQLYFGYENVYADTPMLCFGKKQLETARITIHEPGINSAEQWTKVLQTLAFPLTAESASAFLYGIEATTAGLTSSTMQADTFETVAMLLRAGATRLYKTPQSNNVPTNGVVKQQNGGKKLPKSQLLAPKQLKAAKG